MLLWLVLSTSAFDKLFQPALSVIIIREQSSLYLYSTDSLKHRIGQRITMSTRHLY